jgi:hypothetical protein
MARRTSGSFLLYRNPEQVLVVCGEGAKYVMHTGNARYAL